MKAEGRKHERALSKARQRGAIAKAWFDAGNKLTPKTKPEFDFLMKESDKQWERKN